MRVVIRGGTKSQQKHIRSVTKFCAKKLMPRMSLEITIDIKTINGDTLGYCLPVCEDGERPDRPRSFEIELNSKLKLRKMLIALCHEMVHAKQFAKGELYDGINIEGTRWNGKWYRKEPEYWDRPWEWDAMGREAALFIQWAEHYDYGNRTWTQEEYA